MRWINLAAVVLLAVIAIVSGTLAATSRTYVGENRSGLERQTEWLCLTIAAAGLACAGRRCPER